MICDYDFYREDFRKLGQLWYEPFQYSFNLSPEECIERSKLKLHQKVIVCMHPHGIVPLHAVLWAACCDQFFTNPETNQKLYGFGAAADIVQYVPFLRNVLGFLTAGSASYNVLKTGLMEGRVACIDPQTGRRPEGLFILPGGVAEIYISQPGRHAIFIKKRKGLMRLSIETGASLIPCYVFGGTDFFSTLTTSDSWIAKCSRKLRMALTFFWGRFGLPIPYSPRVTLCVGDPIPIPQVSEECPLDQAIELLHGQFVQEMVKLFDDYKTLAGYPQAELEIL